MNEMKMQSPRLIANYLPQFYPTTENDAWWHKGFTEWTNVGKAKPLFNGHYQPRIPRDLGYYDLRLSEVRQQQADMAKAYGIEGFCYWHYWFGNGNRVLTKVFDEVLKSKEPDFPFCLAWANETWSGRWHGAHKRILMEQVYPGDKDHEAHFYEMLPAFKDERYIKVDGKLFFLIYKPEQLPNPERFISLWNDLAIKNGLKGFYFIAQLFSGSDYQSYIDKGFDAINVIRFYDIEKRTTNKIGRLAKRLTNQLRVFEYEDALKYFVGEEDQVEHFLPTILPNWDHSPRSSERGFILHNSTPDLFGKHLDDVFSVLRKKPAERRISIIKSWNEWGEGNYLEPDLKFDTQYLEVLLKKIKEHSR